MQQFNRKGENMKRKRDKLEEFNHICMVHRKTYAQAQKEESCRKMTFSSIPAHYRKAGERQNEVYSYRNL